MINIPPIHQSKPIKVETIPDITKTWKVGQVLNATTQRGGEALSDVLIKVGKLTIEAKTPIALQDGQDIKLLVKSLVETQSNNEIIKLPLLRILNTSEPDKNNLALIKLRQFIATQQSFSQLTQLSNKLLTNKSNTKLLPEALKNALNTLQNTLLVTPKNINAAQLKQSILNSGVFFESKLSNNSSQTKSTINLESDFKSQLLVIKNQLTQLISAQSQNSTLPVEQSSINSLSIDKLPVENLNKIISNFISSNSESRIADLTIKLVSLLPKTSITQLVNLLGGTKPDSSVSTEILTLSKLLISTLQKSGNQQTQQLQNQLQLRIMLLDLNQQVEQSISKVTSLQLQPLTREGDNFMLLLFNLVFKDSNEHFDIDFRIQQDNKKETAEDESWSVTLNFNFKTLGKVQSKIHLIGNQISSTFQTERVDTANKIKELLPLLEKGLTNAGLTIINIGVEETRLNAAALTDAPVNLLDENA